MQLKDFVGKWLRIVFFNLSFVAVLGVLMRYKIAYSLPFLDQKHLQHAHSHFALSGWITQILMTLMVIYLAHKKGNDIFRKYNRLLYANLITAYGMLIAFAIQGFGVVSISFSILSIIVSFAFVAMFWKDLGNLPVKGIAHFWFRAALVFNVTSSIGSIALTIMMVTQAIHQNQYLLAEYFFLHFQYNGWFIFASMGLLFDKIRIDEMFKTPAKWIFWLFASAIIPAYFLSALWLPLPWWLYTLVVLAAAAQVVGWAVLMGFVAKNTNILFSSIGKPAKWTLCLSAAAFSIKLLLQLGSTIPSLGQLAFGFRPVVIGYLHLVLLGAISLFLIGYVFAENLVTINKKVTQGLAIFTIGIILNELLLMVQGLNAMAYVSIPYINEMLLFATTVMLTGILWLNVGLSYTKFSLK